MRSASDIERRSFSAQMGRSDVIFTFDDITWAAAQQRGMCFPQDRVALALIDDERIRNLLICDQPRSAPVKLGKGLLRRAEPFPASDRVGHYQPLRLRRRDPVRLSDLERYYASYGRRLQRTAERRGLERPVVITAHPFVAAFAALEWAGPVTLLATDDWAVHPTYQRWHPAYRVAYERISAQGTRVCAVTEAIVERIAPRGPAAVVPNGVDPAQWLDIDQPPEWMAKLPGPRFFYVGTLDSRLDTNAVLDVARAWPEGTIVLAGPVADHAHLAAVEDAPNVFLAGTVSRSQVAALALAADACLLPHHRLPLTEAMSPLKIYEYLAGGGPVAATDLPPLHGIGGPVSLAAPGGDFVGAVRQALDAGPMDEPARQRFVERNSWARRCDEVLSLALAE